MGNLKFVCKIKNLYEKFKIYMRIRQIFIHNKIKLFNFNQNELNLFK